MPAEKSIGVQRVSGMIRMKKQKAIKTKHIRPARKGNDANDLSLMGLTLNERPTARKGKDANDLSLAKLTLNDV